MLIIQALADKLNRDWIEVPRSPANKILKNNNKQSLSNYIEKQTVSTFKCVIKNESFEDPEHKSGTKIKKLE